MNLNQRRVLSALLSLNLVLAAMPISAKIESKAPIQCRQLFSDGRSIDQLFWGLKFLRYPQKVSSFKEETTIGIEVEAIFPSSLRRSDLAEAALKFLSQNSEYKNLRLSQTELLADSSVFVSYEYLQHEYIYEFTVDASIRSPMGYEGIEIVSPILRNRQDFQTFQELIEKLKTSTGLKAEPSSAGVHIHVGFPKAKAHELASLMQLFSSIDYQVNDHFQKTRYREQWSEPTDIAMVDYLESVTNKALQASHLLENQLSRYRGLNLKSLKSLGTVEFRLFNSTVDGAQIESYLNFSRGLVEAIRSRDPRLIDFLQEQQEAEHLDFKALAKVLQLNIGNQMDFKVSEEALQQLSFSTHSRDKDLDEHAYGLEAPSSRRAPRISQYPILTEIAKAVVLAAVISLIFQDHASEH
ncbi:MAG: hypothetical protein RJB66_231 [Pseudomonadota bacterium]|jgi:hypothetical protein